MSDTPRLLRHFNAPINEVAYLRSLAADTYATAGHTKDGQIASNRLCAISNMIEEAIAMEREIAARDALLLAFWNEAAVSGLTKEMEVRRPWRKLDKAMRELGLLPVK